MLLPLLLGLQAAAQGKPKPHLLVALVDDLGYSNVGFHNAAQRSPEIDRLAQEEGLLVGPSSGAACKVSAREAMHLQGAVGAGSMQSTARERQHRSALLLAPARSASIWVAGLRRVHEARPHRLRAGGVRDCML